MKKLILLILILTFGSVAFARPVKRIKFPRGATKVTASGYLTGYKDSQIYLIRLRKGQKMTVDANRSVSLYITGPDGEPASDMDLSCHTHQIVENSVAGDYKIKAVECQKADPWKGSFKLTVRVVKSPSLPKPDKINRSQKTEPDKSESSSLQKAIDITEFTQKIEQAKKEYEANPNNTGVKKALASAYFERAFELTKAAQYRAALGDFRKGLKLNPNDKEAQEMHDQIISIFIALGRQPPKEGEEPPPLTVEKKPL